MTKNPVSVSVTVGPKSVADAIQKAIKRAQKSMYTVPIVDGTISNSLKLKFKGAIILIRPGKKEAALSPAVRSDQLLNWLELKILSVKSSAPRNKSVNVWATFRALKML